MPLHEGTTGSIKVGPDGSSVDVEFIGEWEAECDVEVIVHGPFIGNNAKQKVRGGKDCKGSMSGLVPEGTDAGQQDIIDAFNTDADVRLELVQDDGYTLLIPLTIIAKVKIGQKAEEGVPISFDFEANGGYTLAPTA
jgi:hypothetical protein